MAINNSSTCLEVTLLGGFRVSRGDAAMDSFRSDKVRGLLAYLLMHPKRACTRAELAALLWPEHPERAARHNLSQALLLLKKALHCENESPLITADGECVAINSAAAFTVDAHAFERASQLRTDASLRAALDLYAGDFLAHLTVADSAEFETWASMQRERLRQAAASACDRLCELALAARDFAALKQFAQRHIELAPWHEQAHRHLLLALIERGERTAAVRHYETLRRTLANELRVEPEPATQALYARAIDGIAAPASGTAKLTPDFCLPEPVNTCIGRDDERAQLGALLNDGQTRLITLTGAPGVGKTRLALEAARAAQPRFADGACCVELAACGDAGQALEALAQALHVPIGAEQPLEPLCQMLRVRKLLLVLDNLEQVRDFGAIVAALIERCPGLSVIATSREPLHVRCERVFAVDALALHSASSDGQSAAVALFLARARAIDYRFAPDANDLTAIEHICARLDGNALGIELAATWVGALDVREIAREITENVDFAQAHFNDVPERHRSLRAAFEHSWSLLTTAEQRMLACLALFAGGFTREAALRVSGASISTLLSLVNRSLLRRAPGGRYSLHAFVREFAARKGADAADAADQRRDAEVRFSAYFAERAHALLDDFKGRNQRAALAAITADLHDLTQAWRWALDHRRHSDVMRMIEVLEWFYETAERLTEAGALVADALEQLNNRPAATSIDAQLTLAWLRGVHGWVRFRQNDFAGMALVHESAATIDALVDPRDAWHQNVRALAQLRVAYMTAFAGQGDAARVALPACIDAAERAGRPWIAAMARACAGMLTLMQGDPARACAALTDNLREWRAIGDAHGVMTCLSFLTNAMQALGRTDDALKLIGDDLLYVLSYGNRWSVTMATASLARIAQLQGDHRQARALYFDSIRIFADAGDAWGLTSAMVDLAVFLRDAGDVAKSAELLRAVLNHGSSAPPVAARAAQLLAEIETPAALAHVEPTPLWDLAARLAWQGQRELAAA